MKKFVMALAALCCFAAPKAANADFVLSLGPQVANLNYSPAGTFSVDILASRVGEDRGYSFDSVTVPATDGGNSAFIDTLNGTVDINSSFVVTSTPTAIGTFSFDVSSGFVGMISETTTFQIEATQLLPAAGAGATATGSFAAAGTVSAVPEPASAALLGLGAFGLVLRRRRS